MLILMERCLSVAWAGISFVGYNYTMINYDKNDDTAQVNGWKNIHVISHFIICVVFTPPYLDKILLTTKHALSWCDWISAELRDRETIVLPEEDDVWRESAQPEGCHHLPPAGRHGGWPHLLHCPTRSGPAQGGPGRSKVSGQTHLMMNLDTQN
jgi:hypothetical protein